MDSTIVPEQWSNKQPNELIGFVVYSMTLLRDVQHSEAKDYPLWFNLGRRSPLQLAVACLAFSQEQYLFMFGTTISLWEYVVNKLQQGLLCHLSCPDMMGKHYATPYHRQLRSLHILHNATTAPSRFT
jgi:hypothetical protein